MVAGSHEELDDMTRKHKWLASPGPIMKRKSECLKYFHGVDFFLGDDRFIWTPEAEAALDAAILAAGFGDGEPLVRANLKKVAALFLKSPSGKGCTEKGGAGVLPALVLIPVPFSPSLALSSVALVAPPRIKSRCTLSLL